MLALLLRITAAAVSPKKTITYSPYRRNERTPFQTFSRPCASGHKSMRAKKGQPVKPSFLRLYYQYLYF
ncbi:MAG: hypothetical protein LBP62_05080 [Clostridiales bacterium]|nr:hypothetical protein [Clostridiales bacterium]